METDNKDFYDADEYTDDTTRETNLTLFCQEIDAADGFLHWKTLFHLASFNIPETNSFIITSTDQPLAT